MMADYDELFSVLLNKVRSVKRHKSEFDEIWGDETSKREFLYFSYYLRHGALLNCFDNLLYLFCSSELWRSGGLGIKGMKAGIQGGLLIHFNGDQIDKMAFLLEHHRRAILSIFFLHKSEEEKRFFKGEINNICRVVDTAIGAFSETLLKAEKSLLSRV